VYIPKDWKGKIGVIGDMHISSRQSLYKQQQVKAQVIPGADEKISPLIGPMAHENLSSSGYLLSEMKDSDVVALVATSTITRSTATRGSLWPSCSLTTPSAPIIGKA